MEELLKLLEELDVDDLQDYEVIELGDWEQDSKDQLRSSVIQHKETEVYFVVGESRRGSPWTDWDYGETNVYQVEPKEETITVTKWVPLGA